MSDEISRAMLEWAPDIPPTWDVVNLKMLARIFAGGTPDRKNADYWSDGTVPWLNSGSVNDWAISKPSELIAREALANGATRWAPKGSVLVALAGQGKTKGMAARLEIDSTLNQSLAAIVPGASLDYRFLQYWLTSNYLNIRGLAGGDLRDGLNLQHIGSIQVPRPPVEEQRAIADYLDRETAQIDAYIAKNEELIAILSERRAAVIAEAVTRGIDAAASMKASGVEWLGAIPVHWSVQRLASTIARARNGVWGSEPEGGAEDLRCVRVADFDRPRQRIHDRAHTLRKLSASERAGRVLRNGDLLLEKSGGGDKSPVGFVVLYDRDEPAVCSNFVARVQLREGMDPTFWTYVHGALYRLRITEKSLKQSTGIQNLDQSAYFNEYVAVPPYQEQRVISDYLERRSGETDAAIGTARRGVQLARERRAALISAAVTGKIDLREPA
ncbi:restriction endonuclease subunit S [Microbacterium oxydans]|uniref:restriction endonuclease subunit S n=1 Tax=Microbacterium oxydans TaxID=82380 RepID=UPI00366CE638